MIEMLTLAWANLTHRKARCALTLLGVAVAVASFIGLYTLARGPEQSWRNSLREVSIHLVGYEKGVVHIISSQLPITLREKIEAVPGVVEVSPQISRFVPAEGEDRQVVMVGIPADSGFWKGVRITQGRAPKADETWVAVLGGSVAKALGKKVGDTVTLLWRPFTVVGVSEQENPMNNSSVLAPLTALQKLGHNDTTASFFAIGLADPANEAKTRTIIDALNRISPSAVFVRTRDVIRSSQALKMLQAVSFIVSTIAIGMGLLVVSISLVMAITERTREFGILGAIGWSPARAAALVVIEALIVAGLGGLAGCVLGVAIAFGLAAHPVLAGLLEPVFSIELFAWIAGAIVVIGLAGAIYPAWTVARISPVRALQYE